MKTKYDAAIEEKIYFQSQLYDERMNSKVIAQENLDFKQGLVEKLKKQQELDYGGKDGKMTALAINNLAQSLESIKRISKELNHVE